MTGSPIPAAALAAHLAILGKTGAGKSYAARSTVEGILGRGERACIVDPTGVWWGLRLDAKGRPRGGFPAVIDGGRHGDVPLSGDDGPTLARIAGGSSTPLILDTSSLSTAARTRLFTDFAEALLMENVGPLHLVLDEAHLFAPQGRVPDPQSAMMLHAANGLVALGRARGLRVMLLSQRPAKLHKDALSQVETLVAMRFTAPQDRKAVEAWIVDQADRKRGADIVASLPSLKQGEGWVWSPDAEILERVRFPAIDTFDSMRPEAQGSRKLSPIDVAAVRAALAANEAPGDAPTPGPDRAGHARASSAPEIAAAERRGYERGIEEGMRRGRASAEAALAEIEAAAADLVATIEHRRSIVGTVIGSAELAHVTEAARGALAPPRPSAATQFGGPANEEAATASAVTPARQRVLDAIAWSAATGQPEPARAVVAFLCQASPRSSGFQNNLGALRSAGLIHYPSRGALALTASGSAQANPPTEALTHDAMMQRIAGVLQPPRMRILQAVVASYPDSAARVDIAASVNVSATSSGFQNNLGALSSLGLVSYPEPGRVRAADLLFPDQRT